jgi:hypothetical protein
MEQSPYGKANRFSASQELLRILWTRRSIAAFTSARHLSLSWASSVQSIHPHYTSWCPLFFKSYLIISSGLRLSVWIFRNKIRIYGEELLAPRPTPKLEDYTLFAVRECLFNIFADIMHIGGRSSFRRLRTYHAMVTGTHLSRLPLYIVS